MPVHFPQVPLSFNDPGRRKNQVPCNFFQVPDSFARRQDLKKEETACYVRFPPLLWQIYYIFRRNPNAVFPILTFAERRAAAGRMIGDAGIANTAAGRATTAAGRTTKHLKNATRHLRSALPAFRKKLPRWHENFPILARRHPFGEGEHRPLKCHFQPRAVNI